MALDPSHYVATLTDLRSTVSSVVCNTKDKFRECTERALSMALKNTVWVHL